jgi:hypothetical protein
MEILARIAEKLTPGILEHLQDRNCCHRTEKRNPYPSYPSEAP